MVHTPTPNQPLQLKAGNCGFMNVFGVVAGFSLSSLFSANPTATELGSLDRRVNDQGNRFNCESSSRQQVRYNAECVDVIERK